MIGVVQVAVTRECECCNDSASLCLLNGKLERIRQSYVSVKGASERSAVAGSRGTMSALSQ